MLRSSLLLAATAATLLLCTVRADVPGDLIDSLPGFGKTPSKQYSGFLPADEAKSVMLHYWFVTSTNKPETDPIVVWMVSSTAAAHRSAHAVACAHTHCARSVSLLLPCVCAALVALDRTADRAARPSEDS